MKFIMSTIHTEYPVIVNLVNVDTTFLAHCGETRKVLSLILRRRLLYITSCLYMLGIINIYSICYQTIFEKEIWVLILEEKSVFIFDTEDLAVSQ